ncbi:MAG: DNA primase [Proteobacteria bacterium]|nr:DNA primase [Pseudomonadota bacterium]
MEGLIEIYGNEALKQAGLSTEAEKGGQTEKAERHAKGQKAINKRIRELHKISRKTNILRLASVDWSQTGLEPLSLAGHEWDADPWLLCCRNGVIDLRTGDFRPGRPEDYIKVAAPTEWQGLCCPAPILERFLNEIFNGYTDLISYVQRLLGMALIGLSVEHVFFIMWGRGRNGKSTLLEILGFVLGDLAGPIEAEMLLDQGRNRRSGGPTPDIMSLRGRRLVWASETGESRKLNPGKLKWMTGGDTLTGREMYGRRQVSFRPTHTLFLLTNHRPQAPADDYALWQRIHLIPFTQAFVANPQSDSERIADRGLPERLKTEASGILAWLVNGALRYRREGLNPPPMVLQATQDYQEEEDDVGRFIDERCIQTDDARVRASELYDGYKRWSDDNGLTPMSNRKFPERIMERFVRVITRHRYYLGIELHRRFS